MPLPDDLRKTVRVGIQTDGEGLAEKLAVELQNAYGRLAALQNQIAVGSRDIRESQAEWRKLNTEISFLEKQFASASNAVRESDGEWKRLQETLRSMNERDMVQHVESWKRGVDAVTEHTESIRRDSAARKEQIDTFNKLVGVTVLTTKEIKQDEEAIRSHAAAIANAQGTASAWASVVRHAGEELSAMAGRIDQANRAAKEQADTFNRLIGLQVISTQDVQRDTAIVEANTQAHARAGVEQARLNEFLEVAAQHEATAYRARGALIPLTDAAGRSIGGYGKSVDEAAKASEKSAYALLHVSHAFQDLQYGVGAVLNNIPLVVQALGGGPGLAGTIMIAGVALDVLYNNIGRIKEAFSGKWIEESADDVKKWTQYVKDLNEEWAKTPQKIQQTKAAELDLAAAKEAQKIKEMPGETQEGNAQAFKKATKEAGGGAAVESTVHDVEFSNIAQDWLGAMLREIQSGRFHADEKDVRNAAFKASMGDEAGTAAFRDFKSQFVNEVLPAIRNDTMTKLQSGDVAAVNEFMGKAASNPRIGRRDDTDQFANPFLRSLEYNLPANVKSRAELDSRSETADRELKDSIDALKRQRLERKEEGRKEKRSAGQFQQSYESEVSAAASADYKDLDKILLEQALRAKSAGKTDSDIEKQIAGTTRTALGAAGVGGNIKDENQRFQFVEDVMVRILDKVMNAMGAKLSAQLATAAGQGKAIPTPAEAARAEVGEFDEKASREAAAQQGRAGRAAKAADLKRVQSGIQRTLGVDAGVAESLAPEVAKSIKQGANPVQAARAAFAKMQQSMMHAQQTMMEMQATMEQMSGFFGPFSQQLSMVQARNAAVRQNIHQAAGGIRFPQMPTMPQYGGW